MMKEKKASEKRGWILKKIFPTRDLKLEKSEGNPSHCVSSS
jgi:hypothetical protein